MTDQQELARLRRSVETLTEALEEKDIRIKELKGQVFGQRETIDAQDYFLHLIEPFIVYQEAFYDILG